MKKQPLLVIGSDPVQQAQLERVLSALPYSLSITSDAEQAFDAFGKIHHEVALCDLDVPGAESGIELVRRFRETANPPIVVMLTSENKTALVIKAVRLGAYDFVVKPLQPADLEAALARAFARAAADAAAREAGRERAEYIEKRLASRQVVEHLVRRQNDKFNKALFGNMFTSFSQGRGIGSLATLVAMLSGSPQTDDGKSYLVPKEILELIFDNQDAVNAMIDMFSELHLLVSQDFVLYDVSLGEFHKIVSDMVFELAPLINLRSHTVVMSDLPPRFAGESLKMNWEFMRKAMRELIVNALKFSEAGTTVTVLIEHKFTHLLVTVLNPPITSDSQGVPGIPEEYRRLVFEPFFRTSRVVREEYRTLDYGLGLTLVDKIVSMHRGKMRCTSVQNYAHDEGSAAELIAFEIELPT